MNNSVCAVVVTFNRKELLTKCISSLLDQTLKLQTIIIVDNNSTDKTEELLLQEGYIKSLPDTKQKSVQEKTIQEVKIKYIRLPENMGGAGGFYEGVKTAYEDNYDWIWIMDDDAFPTKTCLENLKPYYNLEDTVALASLKVDLKNNILYHHRGYFNFTHGLPIQEHITQEDTQTETTDIDMASFVGLLIKKEAITNIGYPKKEFFIHADDLEYCIRLRSKGKIKLINKSIIKHAEGSVQGTFKKTVLGITVDRRPYKKLWINYYMQRNLIWLGRKYSQNKLSLYTTIIKNYLMTLIGIILFDDHKIKRIKFYTNAYTDGLKSNFNNKKPKQILYGED
ncbi:MAG: glycosyltransferase family 2 protein [Methanosphaera sp.]|nr:glycosyltransferase family 2 protein [Methanosphaera sp.]